MRLLRGGIGQGVPRQFIVDLVDFQDSQPIRQRIQIVLDFPLQHIPVHHFDFRGMNKHFLQLAAFAENDVGSEHFAAPPQVFLQILMYFLVIILVSDCIDKIISNLLDIK